MKPGTPSLLLGIPRRAHGWLPALCLRTQLAYRRALRILLSLPNMPSGVYIRTKPAWNKDKHIQTNSGKTHFPKGHTPANKGIKRPGVGGRKKGGIPWNKGIKSPYVVWNKGMGKPKVKKTKEEWRKNLSLSHIGKMMGEKNPRWKGGITPEHNKIRASVESKLWINAVYARDGYTCQKTGEKGGRLVAHHILNFAQWPDLRFAIDNGITLSRKSHEEFHRIYGKKDNNRSQLEEYLGKKI